MAKRWNCWPWFFTMYLAGIAWAIREVGQYEVLGCACYEHVTSMQHVQTVLWSSVDCLALAWKSRKPFPSYHDSFWFVMIQWFMYDDFWYSQCFGMIADDSWCFMIVLWLYDSHSHPKIRVGSSIYHLVSRARSEQQDPVCSQHLSLGQKPHGLEQEHLSLQCWSPWLGQTQGTDMILRWHSASVRLWCEETPLSVLSYCVQISS